MPGPELFFQCEHVNGSWEVACVKQPDITPPEEIGEVSDILRIVLNWTITQPGLADWKRESHGSNL